MPNVLKVSEAATLALHTMVRLAAEPDKLHSTKSIASLLGVSEAHLSKVLQRLAHAGLVKSIRGPKGGFSLTRPAEKIKLIEIYELIEGPLQQTNCLLGKQLCDGDKCILGNLLSETNRQVRDYLSKTSIADVTGAYEGAIDNA